VKDKEASKELTSKPDFLDAYPPLDIEPFKHKKIDRPKSPPPDSPGNLGLGNCIYKNKIISGPQIMETTTKTRTGKYLLHSQKTEIMKNTETLKLFHIQNFQVVIPFFYY